MFRLKLPAKTPPFDEIFSDTAKYIRIDNANYPYEIQNFDDDKSTCKSKGRFNNIRAKYDERFPNYNANFIQQGEKGHILLEGPAQHISSHSKRFMEVLLSDVTPVSDVIAAGDPNDGRCSKRGYLFYFADEKQNELDADDKAMLNKINYDVTSQKICETGQIVTYKLSVTHESKSREIMVHHFSKFGDFEASTFDCDEIKRLLEIFLNAKKNLAMHCSAGVGRTGVFELAYCLFRETDKFYPDSKPDFEMIKLKLQELRELRPALIQTPDQYRMAIILGLAMFAAEQNTLTKEKMNEISQLVDQAALERQQGREALRTARGSCGSDLEDESDSLSFPRKRESP
ncbi:MAG TPA: protein-tyrosine phosphatase family protein [Gammaproteobacteria bacterium]|nr:protein-tyrosine phosphatase family protein [Gammaproteobacteria bacterium]